MSGTVEKADAGGTPAMMATPGIRAHDGPDGESRNDGVA
jgi:hypothetical protein